MHEGNGIYIIDQEYHLVYINQKTKSLFPHIQEGAICYQEFRGETKPCEDCPLQKTAGEHNGPALLYNKVINQWIETSYAEIDWPDAGPCVLIVAKEIVEDNKNLLLALTEKAAYDELFELNVTHNRYRILFHKQDKYVIPAREGVLDEMCQDVAEHMIHPDDREAFLDFWDFDKMPQIIRQTGNVHAQFRKKLLKGDYCWVEQRVVAVRQGNEEDDNILMCFIMDINEKKEREKAQEDDKLRELTEHNALTGLYNGQYFFQKAEQLLHLNIRTEFCLMVVDIEHFKIFNEWYGLAAGDRLLKSVANELQQVTQKATAVAGYFGGDDFAIILPNQPALLKELQDKIKHNAQLYEDSAGFMPAFGLFAIEDRTLAISQMYDRAVMAMNAVKGNYVQRVSWYDASMKQKLEKGQELLREIQRALKQREFVVYAQPRCHMRTGKIIGLESLVRWQHPQKGLIMPGEFIPMLEENGFITNLDLYMWEEVCRLLRQWIDDGYQAVPISVNISRIDFYAVDLIAVLTELLQRYDLQPDLLELEITESAYARDYEQMTKTVSRLREEGFHVLLDDFGSAYSSLNILKDVNVDILKIDMKFLDLTDENLRRGMGILDAIIRMAKWMGFGVIAEGVEMAQQMEFLLELGCECAQGYYFYRPAPIKEVEKLLMNHQMVDMQRAFAVQNALVDSNDVFGQDISVK